MYFQLILTVSLTVWQCHVFGGVILRDAEDNEICESEDCYNTANHILKWLNPEVDPCEDFYEFTCGNWRNLPVDERVNRSIGARGSLVEKYIPVLLNDPSATNGKKYFEDLRKFMITCMDEETIQSLGVTPIKQLIQKAGGWPVLDADWSEKDWDFLNADITMGGALIYVDTSYFKEKNSSTITSIISLGPSPRFFRPTQYWMVDVAVALGADKEVARKAIKEVIEFERDFFDKELTSYRNLSRIVTTYTNLQEEVVPWIDLTKLLEIYLPQSFKLLLDTNIMYMKNYFLVLDDFIKQYPTETLVNFMMSKAVYPLFEFVHHNLNISLHMPNSHWYEEKELAKSRLQYCTKTVEYSSLGPAMAAYLGSLNTDSSKVAVEMTEVIIKELSKEVEETEWLDEVTREESLKNISEIKIDVGFPPWITDLDELDKLYEGYEMDTSNFFNARIYDRKWIKQRDFDSLYKNVTVVDDEIDLGWRYYMLKGLKANGNFDPKKNSIDVSGPMLYFLPLFSPENPAYVNYGHVGTVVAHELIHSVDFNAAPEDEKKYLLEMERWGSNHTENIYVQKKQCFIDFYSSFNDTKTTKLTLNGASTQREDIADNGGLKLSLRAYRKLADQLGSPERKLPRLQQYSIEQLFMISAANIFCEIPYEESLTKQLEYDNHSLFEFRVKGIMMNSPDFSEIFNCKKKDSMNPPDKCEVW